eukprot:745708-Hanusia_phi.AAC.2
MNTVSKSCPAPGGYAECSDRVGPPSRRLSLGTAWHCQGRLSLCSSAQGACDSAPDSNSLRPGARPVRSDRSFSFGSRA